MNLIILILGCACCLIHISTLIMHYGCHLNSQVHLAIWNHQPNRTPYLFLCWQLTVSAISVCLNVLILDTWQEWDEAREALYHCQLISIQLDKQLHVYQWLIESERNLESEGWNEVVIWILKYNLDAGVWNWLTTLFASLFSIG